MPSMRKVRKDFRKEVLRQIRAGDGNIENLVETAGQHFGIQVGYEVLIKSFLQSEVSNAVSQLRNEGHIETIGKKWKAADELQREDVSIISVRRLKRLRGELKSQIRLDHDHGLIDEAAEAQRLLEKVEKMLIGGDGGTSVAVEA